MLPLGFGPIGFLAIASLAIPLGACGPNEQRPPFASDQQQLDNDEPTADGNTGADLIDELDDAEPTNNCGEVSTELDIQRPNFYFILDSSESMVEVMPDSGGISRHLAARQAIGDVLRRVGHRVNFGAATFPYTAGSEGCAPGREVFEVRPGDPLSDTGERGRQLEALEFTLRKRSPSGATPVAETLAALAPALTRLEGNTFVFLLTDGAPNCAPDASCAASNCIPNIESAEFASGLKCDASFNCCAPDLLPQLCLDGDGTNAQLEALRDRGVETYIIGIPGSEIYETVLSSMAQAAGTARANEATAYYRVEDAAGLALLLTDLGHQLSLSCEFELGSSPARRDLVHVLADEVELELGNEDGWRWQGDTTVLLQGHACERWKRGETYEVRVIEGCVVEFH